MFFTSTRSQGMFTLCLTLDFAYVAEAGLMFLKMIMIWRVLAGMVHPLREIKQGKSGKRRSEMRVVEATVVLLYLKELSLVDADEKTIKTGHYISHTSSHILYICCVLDS